MRKIMMASITAVVVIAVLAGTLIPILDDATATTKTFENDGVPFAVPDSGTHTIVMDSTGMTSDGESVTGFEFLYGNSVSILYCERNVVRWNTDGTVQVIGDTSLSGQRRIVGDTDINTVTLTITNGVAVFTNSDSDTYPEVTLSGIVLAYPTADENAKYRQGTEHYYTDDTDLIIAGGFTNHAVGGQVALVMTGTVDSISAGFVWYYNVPATVGNIDVQTSDVCTNLHKIDKILVTMDITGTSDTYELTYTQFLSEATGTYDSPNYVGSAGSAILAAIPVLVIVAVLLGVIALVLRSKMD